MTVMAARFRAISVAGGALWLLAGCATAPVEPVTLAGIACESPPPAHCPEADCPVELFSELGNAIDSATGRQFFLDYPCDLKPGEDVTFVLSLHGGGSIANWQRNYFPLMDYKEKYRLVIATPSGTSLGWRPDEDDAHLHNIVKTVENATAESGVHIKAFWLAGHSLGGQTANRLINDDPFFSSRLDGWVSLSGGRLGSKREDVRATIPRGSGGPGGAPPRGAAGGAPPGPRPAAAASADSGAPVCRGLVACAEFLPDTKFSFIYETGSHELTDTGLPGDSPWADKLGCRAQAAPRTIVDDKAGYVYDTREQANHNPIWGTTPRPGSALIYDYPGCADGRVVADVVRRDKGHTEGLEPHVTEEIIRMMLAAG